MHAELKMQEIQFLSFLQEAFEKNSHVQALQAIRMRAWERFMQLGLPDTRHEAFQYIRLKQLFQETFSFCSDGLEKQEGCAFVNGKLSTIQAPKGVIALSIQDALKTYSTLLKSLFSKSIEEEADPFAMMNTACFQDGLFLYIPPKMIVEQPIHISQIMSGNEQIASFPRIAIVVGAHAQAQIVYTQKASIQNYFSNAVCDLHVEDGAHVTVLYDGSKKQKAGDSFGLSWSFDALRAKLKKQSTLNVIQAAKCAHVHRHDIHVDLLGQGADASLNGLWMLKGSSEMHTNVVICHHEPHATSMQLFKGVLTDQSKSSFQGKIYVAQKAQKTQAYQLNNNLVLSRSAEAHSKPNLEIFADDVKASHGATVGKLDPEQLFYLKTRGFSEQQAQNTLISGFLQEVVACIPMQNEKKVLECEIIDFLKT